MLKKCFGLFAILFLVGGAAEAGVPTHLMRRADLSTDSIVFTYEGDLWIAPRDGGDAFRITRSPGLERYAKFSPDGSLLAFTASYDGGTDVYVMDARGGAPRRLTWHPSRDRVLGWTPDGRGVLFRSDRVMPFRAEELYVVDLDGGMPRRLPVDQAGLASFSPDGKMIAYNRITREDRTWKRHQGGTAQNIWMGSLDRGDFHRVTDWIGTDNYPMWSGDSIYFTSDRRHGTMNLFCYQPATETTTQLTDDADYDVKYPSAGPGGIIFQYGERLQIYDFTSGKVKEVPIEIRSDRVEMRDARLKAGSHAGSFRSSPDGKRLLLETMGELALLPSDKKEEARALTTSSASREKDAVFSPDGKQIAYLSDSSGEEELWVMDADGSSPRQLTNDRLGFRYRPIWSPDGQWIAFGDKTLALNLVKVESDQQTIVDRGEYDDAWYRWGIQDYAFSPDSAWIAYTKVEASLNDSIFLYRVADGARFRVTGHETRDWSPSFSLDGKYLYFLSDRTFNPTMGRVDQNHIFLDMTRPYLVLLDQAAFSPFTLPIDEDEKEAVEKEDVVVKLDPEGIEKRVLLIPGVKAGDYDRLEAAEGGFLYLERDEHPFLKYQEVNDHSSAPLKLMRYQLAKDKSSKLMDGVANYHMTPNGGNLAYHAGGKYGLAKIGTEIKVGENQLRPEELVLHIDHLQEYRQIFDEAWRIQRDWFYDPGMHGVNWKAIRDKYRVFIPDCGNRADLNYLIGEMIGELNAGHTYIYGGDRSAGVERVPVGLLGADFEQPEGAPYPKIARIIPGHQWKENERSPLEEPGCSIHEGQYLIGINDRGLKDGANLFGLLENSAGHTITIRFNDLPKDEGASECRIRPLSSERGLRYRAWVEHNRRVVNEASGGRVGYLHIPDMMGGGLVEFARGWYHDFSKQAFIIDERYNGGGFVGDMIIDRLERRVWSYTKPREAKPIPSPERTMNGPLAVLINEGTGSNGEYFAEAIKIKGLAPLIGVRTWGGAVGIEPHQHLLDGATTTPPQFAPYGLNRKWLIEGHGVDPDIVVENKPVDVLQGVDAQLDEAIGLLVKQIEKDPRPLPDPPPYPDKSKTE